MSTLDLLIEVIKDLWPLYLLAGIALVWFTWEGVKWIKK